MDLPCLYVNPSFQQTMDIQLLAGRWFSREFPGDDSLKRDRERDVFRWHEAHPDGPTKAIGDGMDTPAR